MLFFGSILVAAIFRSEGGAKISKSEGGIEAGRVWKSWKTSQASTIEDQAATEDHEATTTTATKPTPTPQPTKLQASDVRTVDLSLPGESKVRLSLTYSAATQPGFSLGKAKGQMQSLSSPNGKRDLNQDAYIAECSKTTCLFAVLDGHGEDGHNCAQAAKQKLEDLFRTPGVMHVSLKQHAFFGTIVVPVLASVTSGCDDQMSGATLTGAIVQGASALLFNLGDSRTVLESGGRVFATVDHALATNEPERTCSHRANPIRNDCPSSPGWVSPKSWPTGMRLYMHPDTCVRVFKGTTKADCSDPKSGYMMPGLQASRGLGDNLARILAGFGTMPELRLVTIEKEAHLVVGCDGLYEELGFLIKKRQVTEGAKNRIAIGFSRKYSGKRKFFFKEEKTGKRKYLLGGKKNAAEELVAMAVRDQDVYTTVRENEQYVDDTTAVVVKITPK